MATDVVMPQMGESIAEGTIVRWIKKVGDTVERDEPLFEISTDKVDAEIPSPAAGVVTEIRVKEGETVPVNSVVAVIGAGRRAAAEQRRSRRRRRSRSAEAAGAAAAADADRSGAAAGRRRRPSHATRRSAAPPQAPHAAPSSRGRAAASPRRSAGDADRQSAEETIRAAVVAARAQDREGAQRRHLADSAAPASPAA